MQTQDRVKVKQVVDAITASQKYLLSMQNRDGYWWAELESNVTITSRLSCCIRFGERIKIDL